MIQLITKYADKKFIRSMIALITIEQLALAVGTALLALIGKHISSPDKLIQLLLGFILVGQIPNLIFVFLRRTEARGYVGMYFNFLKDRLFDHSGRPSVWANKAQRETYLTAIGAEADNYISALTYCCFDIFTYTLNVLLNALALSVVIDRDFIWVFGFSAAMSFFTFYQRSAVLNRVVETEQQAKLDLLAYTLKSWDNIFLSNASIQQRFQTEAEKRYERSRELAGKSAFQSGMSVLILTLVSSFPVYVLNLYLIYAHRQNPEFIAAVMVTLPRQVQLLGTFRAFFQQITNVKIFASRLRNALKNSELRELDLLSKTDFSRIRVNGSSVECLEKLMDLFRNRSNGRILISGENGSGKTSLLLILHSRLKNSFYLPPAPDLEVSECGVVGSTGQRMLMHLEFIARQSETVLLLDEWDANLDISNQALVSQALDQLSQQKLVIEVSHNV